MDKKTWNKKKRWLNRYQKILDKLSMQEEELARLDDEILKTKSPNYSGMPRGGKGKDLEDLIQEKVLLEDIINDTCRRKVEIQSEILRAIYELSDPRKIIVLKRYHLNGKGFNTISDELGYSVRHVRRFYSQGVEELKI